MSDNQPDELPYSEQVFDYLTKEMLDGPKPPDLRERIVEAWKRENQAPADQLASSQRQRKSAVTLVPAELVESATDTPSDFTDSHRSATESLSREVKSLGVSDARQAARARVSGKVSSMALSRSYPRIAAFVAAAAAVVIALGIWSRQPTGVGPGNNANVVAEKQDQATAEPGQLVPENSERQLVGNDAKSTDATDGAAQPLDLNDLPFDLAATPDLRVTPENSRDATTKTATPLSDVEVVARLNDMLADMWDAVGVAPTPSLTSTQFRRKLSAGLAGGDAAVESGANRDETLGALENRLQTARQVTNSTAAARGLAEQFATEWLLLAEQRETAEAKVLSQYLARELQSGNRWQQVVADVLGGELGESASAASVAFYSPLVQGGQPHELLRSLGSNFLNTNLACSRCHDAAGGSFDPGAEIGSQNAYWSTLALFKGISKERQEAQERRLQDRQDELFAKRPPTLFYELADGKMQAAQAELPGSESWRVYDSEKPRLAFARWLASSQWIDQATVNQVWQIAMGRRLVPLNKRVDLAAVQSRLAIQDFLSQQFRAHGGDVRKLATWIAGSDAFTRSPHSLDAQQWLAASDTELADMQLAELVFAAQPSVGLGGEMPTLDNSLAMAMRWSGSTTRAAENSLLAQAALDAGQGKRERDQQPRLAMPPLSLALHGQRPTVAEQRYVESLVGNQDLSWDEKVEHVLLLGDRQRLSPRVRELVAKTRKQLGGNDVKTLQLLLWSVKSQAGL